MLLAVLALLTSALFVAYRGGATFALADSRRVAGRLVRARAVIEGTGRRTLSTQVVVIVRPRNALVR